MLCTCKTDSVPSEDFSSPKHIIQGSLQNKTHPPLCSHWGFCSLFTAKNTNSGNPLLFCLGRVDLRESSPFLDKTTADSLCLCVQCLKLPYGDKSSFIHNHFYCSSLRGLELGQFPIKAHSEPLNKCCAQGPLSIFYKPVVLFIKKVTRNKPHTLWKLFSATHKYEFFDFSISWA